MEEKLQLISSSIEEEVIEEFYEKIEAPKFVDFTLPNHFCPDDCYWFCSRVGCDQQHEEEMDSEAIYKNFVLRVMAARSPNVKLRRAIIRKSPSGSKKCPFSAPPKSSKSRLPRLALVASSISKKLLMNEEKGNSKALPANAKPVSTPKARVKHVAAKYMTSPRKKERSSPNPNVFRSVRNPKKTSISLPKSKIVAKALMFNPSPRKAIKMKAPQELGTPITKLCEGVKQLKINSQKKGIITHKSSKDGTSEKKRLPSSCKAKTRELSTPITKLCEGVNKLKINSQKKGIITHKSSKDCTSERKKLPSSCKEKAREVDGKFSRSVKSKAKTKDRKCVDSVLEEVEKSGDESSDMEIDEKSRCGSLGLGVESTKPGIGYHSSFQEEGSTSLITQKCEINSGSDSDKKASAEEDSEPIRGQNGDEQSQEKDNTTADELKNQNLGVVSELEDDDDKRNGLNSADIRSEVHSGSDSNGKLPADENYVAMQAPSKDEESQGKENNIADDLENQNPGAVNELMDNDDKENASNSTDIRNLNSENLSKKDAPIKPKVKTKQHPQKLDKATKENCPAGTGMQVLKSKKLKPTNPKPFRLRTDERGILKEATLERKVHSHENSFTTSENSMGTGNGVSDKKDEGRSLKKDQIRPIKSRYKSLKEVKPKSQKSCETTKTPLLQKQGPQREIVSRVKSRVLDPTEKNETTKLRPKKSREHGKEVGSSTKKASAVQKSSADEKRPAATIPREPNFHSLHKLKGCTRIKP
ncbi:uncharacterized protein LOC104904812 [Beta vulgaris subsp. vulgaris]|uniref:uncharacterized protein LOC104904812 n=1 Tax=Beta vulgaris subsp. vulgaris TaxID=3555 RepID=UPI002036961C|nr:uncharacterized protein LOC104904812 [Beta vulgaris subsp. vulgaris]